MPLRPLGLGDILNGAFALIRNHPATTLGLAFVVMAVSATISTLMSSGFLAEYERSLEQLVSGQVSPDDPIMPVSGGSMLLMMLGTAVSYLAVTLLTALLTSVVGMAVLGHKFTVSQVWTAVRGRIWAILGLSVLQYLIHFALAMVMVVLMLGGALLGAFLAATGSQALGAVIALASVLLGFLGGLALFAWIGVRIYLAMPIVVLERLGPGSSLARSWRLTKGNWWRMLGIVALTLLIVIGVSLILMLALGLLAGLPMLLSDGDLGMTVANVLGVVVEALTSSITTPFLAAVTTLLYIDLRMRREGLDLRLHWVAQQGVPVGPEIYRPEQHA
ncbi:glycerophosphoryl diester phosphodiesterase membrane domain-containing protein [Nocardiopsis kunsanensis]|uniref:glycerophosphoryl diester phosphodiesterase membrane domain-containing protein n=1 Tax=Nocardiopsis kunsanensis TaxID=141693 RepID=UPI0003764043|nr:glycerophosphoryl diester phosphodiesterase membrane domain-containing protein [Nocardiopsis kunsanensis]